MAVIIIESSVPEIVPPTPEPIPVSTPPQLGWWIRSCSRVWEFTWPKLIWLLTPVLWAGKFVIQLYVLLYIRVFNDKKISTRAKCPACGCRKEHKIHFSHDYD